jgi:hypothetical protein
MDLEDPSVDPQVDDGGVVPDSGDTFGADHCLAAFNILITVGFGTCLILVGVWILHNPDKVEPPGVAGAVIALVPGAVFVLMGCTGCVLMVIRMCCSCLTFDLFLQKMIGGPRVDH